MHYEHLIPASEGDIQKTVDMVNLYISGTESVKWAHDHTLTYFQVVGTKPHVPDMIEISSDIHNQHLTTPSKSKNKRDYADPPKRSRKSNMPEDSESLTPTKEQAMPHKTHENLHKNKPKRVKLADPIIDYCINLSNRFDLLEEEVDDELTISMKQPTVHSNTRFLKTRRTLCKKANICATQREPRSPTKQMASGQNTKRKRETSISVD